MTSPTPPTTDDLIAILASLPDRVDALTAQAPAIASAPSQPDEWTANQVVGHLSDAARMWGGRMRFIVFEDEPHFIIFDENAYVMQSGYRYVPLATLAAVYRLNCEANVALLRGLAPAQWERAGVHPERGRLTLREIVALEAEHERQHAEQLARA
jgi:hypothetical protein